MVRLPGQIVLAAATVTAFPVAAASQRRVEHHAQGHCLLETVRCIDLILLKMGLHYARWGLELIPF